MAKLYFHYSTMNAGKSTHLIQVAYNYRERGMKAIPFTFGTGEQANIESRVSLQLDAIPFNAGTDFHELLRTTHATCRCVLVDEAQFLTPAQVKQLARVVDEFGVPVMCYGLRTDFRGELFPGSAALLAIADTLVEIKTICACGRKATMVVRVGELGGVEREGEQVEIGGNERYVSLCRKHWTKSVRMGAVITS